MKTRATAVVIISASLLLSACSSPPDSAKSSGKTGTLTIASTDNLESLDPASAFVGWSTSREGVTETLVGVDEKLGLVPGLATAWKNVDPTTWEITLRDGVTFHNGKKMDAAAVKESLEYSIKTNVRAKAQLPLESITVDGTALTVRTSKPLPALPHILTDPMMSIQALGEGIDPKTKPIATGPFKIDEYVPQQRRRMSAHKQYWHGEPKLSQVVIRSYADAQAMNLALQSGEADIVVKPDAAGLPAFSDKKRFKTWENTSTRSDGVIINTQSPVMNDVRAREAINHAIDRDAYVSLKHGMAKRAFAFFPENVAFGGGEGLDVKVTKKDLAKTKEIFTQLGYTESDGKLVKDGKPLTIRVLTYSTQPTLGSMSQLIQSDLRGIGITVEITELKSALDALKAGSFDLGMYSMGTAPTGDPEYFFTTMLRSDADTNYSRYNSPEFDAKLAELSQAYDPAERLQKARKVQQQLLNDLPYIMFSNQQWWAVSKANVQGLAIRPTEYHMISHETNVG